MSVGSRDGDGFNLSVGLLGQCRASTGNGVIEGGNRSLISNISGGMRLLASAGGLHSKA